MDEQGNHVGVPTRLMAEKQSLRDFNKEQLGRGRSVRRDDVWHAAWTAALTWTELARLRADAAPTNGEGDSHAD